MPVVGVPQQGDGSEDLPLVSLASRVLARAWRFVTHGDVVEEA